jgi:IMP dehydrogenase/GMP reductase
MFKNLRQTITFDDVLLVPQYSDIESRSEVDIGTKIKNIVLKAPVISSPMDTVVNEQMAVAVVLNGGLPILHRYNNPQEQAAMFREARDKVMLLTNSSTVSIGAAVGTTADELARASILASAGVNVFCIDVAHGHHIAVRRMIETLRDNYGEKIHIMAGNIATTEAFTALSNWGADSIRVGVGGGCFTPGTLVRTTEGDKPIEQIAIGEQVLTHTGNVRSVIDTLCFDRDEEIAVINGIEATKNHEFYVVDKTKQHLITEDNLQEFVYWIEAEHLDKTKHLLVELE